MNFPRHRQKAEPDGSGKLKSSGARRMICRELLSLSATELLLTLSFFPSFFSSVNKH